MSTALIWLTKLLLAHLLTDFVLQPRSWVLQRQLRHFGASQLWIHALVAGLSSLVLVGYRYWLPALIISLSHLLIDGWKSYQKQTVAYFLIDQALHLLVILLLTYFTFLNQSDLQQLWQQWNQDPGFWKVLTAFVFVTTPAGILIGQLTHKWRVQLPEAESLANAGKWIGIAERTIILLFVVMNQFSAIGLLVAAKGIIRFNEKDRQEIKTEYLVVGTLLSIALAVLTGLLLRL